MLKRNLLISLFSLMLLSATAQQSDTLYTFRFVPKQNVFYVPYQGNGVELDRLLDSIRVHSREIAAGQMYLAVSSYAPKATPTVSAARMGYLQSSRVKSELILRGGITEHNFVTDRTFSHPFGDTLRNVVVVTFPAGLEKVARIAGREAAAEVEAYIAKVAAGSPEARQVAEAEREAALPAEQECKQKQEEVEKEVQRQNKKSEVEQIVAEQPETLPVFTHWSVGANVGIPFFWGDMVTMAADKTYIDFSVGVQGSYRFSQLLAVSLSADYAQGKAGTRDYAKDYLLTPDGLTHYTPQAGAQYYNDLYSKIGVFSLGLSLDVNVNRFFFPDVSMHRFMVWVSPTIYGQSFRADVYAKSGDAKFSDGSTTPSGFSLGLGGSLGLRYKVSKSIEMQLKNSLLWITDNKFDGIMTPYGTSRQNAMWTPQIGVIWNIK